LLSLVITCKQANKINTDKNTKSAVIEEKCNNKEKRSMCILMKFRPNRAQKTRGRRFH